MASVIVNVISRADNSGFARASRGLAKITALAGAATVGAAGAAQAVGAVAVAGASVGALALPALGAVVAGLDGIKKAAGTAQGQLTAFRAAMSSSFAGMATGFGTLGGVLTAITPQMQGVGRAITSVFNGMADTVAANTTGLQALAAKGAEFVTRLGPGLNTLIDKAIAFGAAINVDALFSAFSTIGQLLGPLVDLFVQLGAAAGPLGSGFAILGGIITALTPSLVQVAETLGPALAQSMATLAPTIGQLGAAFASVVSAIAPALPVIAAVVAALVSGLGPVLPVIVAGLLAIGPAIKIVAAAIKVWSVVQWALNSALLANPITWVVIAVVALIAAIVLIATKTTWFQTIWSAMCAAAVATWNWFKGVIAAFVGWIVGVWNNIVAAGSAAWNALRAIVGAVFGAVRAIIGGAIGVVVGHFNRVRAVGASVFGAVRSIISTVGDAISTVVGWVQNLISAISNISWPSPPGWLSSMFGGLDPAMFPGQSAFMAPQWTITPSDRVHLASGYPSLTDIGGLGGRGVTVLQDNSVTVQVDGSGIVDEVAVGRQIERVLSKYRVTSGQRAAVQF